MSSSTKTNVLDRKNKGMIIRLRKIVGGEGKIGVAS